MKNVKRPRLQIAVGTRLPMLNLDVNYQTSAPIDSPASPGTARGVHPETLNEYVTVLESGPLEGDGDSLPSQPQVSGKTSAKACAPSFGVGTH